MKKIYIKPEVDTIEFDGLSILSSSPEDPNTGRTQTGIDTDGTVYDGTTEEDGIDDEHSQGGGIRSKSGMIWDEW